MFIGNPAGNYDRILDFSAAVTGCMFFAPSADFLRNPPGPPGLPVRAPVAREPAAPEQAAPEPSVWEPVAREPATREPDLADVSAPGIPRPPGPAEHVDGLTRSGPAVTIPPRV